MILPSLFIFALIISPVASFVVNFCAETHMYHQSINTCREDLKTYAAPVGCWSVAFPDMFSCTLLGPLNSPSRIFSTARRTGFPSKVCSPSSYTFPFQILFTSKSSISLRPKSVGVTVLSHRVVIAKFRGSGS